MPHWTPGSRCDQHRGTRCGITGRSAYGPKCRYRHFGPAFLKVCAYFPYPAKIWVNGHEWAKRQAVKAGHRLHRAVQRLRVLR